MNLDVIRKITAAYMQGIEDARNGIPKEHTTMNGSNAGTFMAWDQGWEDGQDLVRLPVTSKVCTDLTASVVGKEFNTDLTPNKAREVLLEAKEKAFRGGFETCARYLGATKKEMHNLEALRSLKWLDWDDTAHEWAQQVEGRMRKVATLSNPPQIVKAKDLFRF